MVLDKDRWIPIAALPLDLQLAALESTDRLRIRRRGLYSANFRGLLYTGIVVLLIGLAYALIDSSAAFASPGRLLSLLLGGLLVALYFVSTLGRGFGSAHGQKIVVGETSLVLVDRQHVRVIPGEAIKLVLRRVDHGAEVLDKDLADDALRSRLQQVVTAAEDDPSRRENDRFRKAAAEVSPVSPLLVRLRAYEPVLLGLGLVASLTSLLEAGPIQARAEVRVADTASARLLAEHGHEIAMGRDAFVAASLDLVKAASLAKRHKPMLEQALRGSVDDVRAFLTTYGPKDEGSPSVRERLHELCLGQVSIGDYDPEESRALRGALRVICESTDGRTLSYVDHADATRAKVEYFLTQYFMTELAKTARPLMTYRMPSEITKVIIDEKTATGPFLVLQMKHAQTLYDVTLTPHDASGKPLPRAVFRRPRVAL